MTLPVCDHYSGVEARMRKSLQLQAEMQQEFGHCVFDVTLDCEDGAPWARSASTPSWSRSWPATPPPAPAWRRACTPWITPHLRRTWTSLPGQAGQRLCHIMIPKVESVDDVLQAERALLAAGAGHLRLHALIESPAAVHRAFEIAAHPRIQSLSFGLMDFVSAHGGAIPASGMTSAGQFQHPLVVRAKLEIAAACHANGKVPSHCVVTEFSDTAAMQAAAGRAAREFGYTRMWSIHPAQIRPILAAFAPEDAEIARAARIIACSHRRRLGPHQRRRRAARPRQLPLFLAVAGACTPDRTCIAATGAGLVCKS